MTEEVKEVKAPVMRAKRDVVRFNGDNPIGIDLGYVKKIQLQGKNVSIWCDQIPEIFPFADEKTAQEVFEAIMMTWCSEIEQG